jgi:hypothetical protein
MNKEEKTKVKDAVELLDEAYDAKGKRITVETCDTKAEANKILRELKKQRKSKGNKKANKKDAFHNNVLKKL